MKHEAKTRALTEIENLSFAVATITAVVTVVGSLDFVMPTLDNLTNFRAFYAAAALLALPALLIRRNLGAVLAAAVLTLNALPVARYYVPIADVPVGQTTVKATTINAFGGGGDIDKLIAELQRVDTDIVFVSELTEVSRARLREIYPNMIWDEASAFNAVLTKFPVVSSDVGIAGHRPYRNVVLDTPLGHVRVLGVHAMVPTWDALVLRRNEGIAVIGKIAAESEIPVIALGDFNITMFSPHYAPLEASLTNLREGRGVLGSWPAQLPVRIPIDHVLVSNELVGLDLQLGASFDSDHLPVHSVIGLR